jgi:hypothetical protein
LTVPDDGGGLEFAVSEGDLDDADASFERAGSEAAAEGPS